MNRAALATAIILLLSACSATPRSAEVGSMLSAKDSTVQKRIAGDFAEKMAALYPPARAKLKLKHGTPDAFGTALVESLRQKGYALTELAEPRYPGAPSKVKQTAADLELSYVVDQPLGASMVRATVYINTQSLSRLYETKEHGAAAAGYWVRKE